MFDVERWTFSESRYLSRMKSVSLRIFFAVVFAPLTALASNSVVNMSHYDLMRVDFVAMKSEGVVGVIHEATFPRLQRDSHYAERQSSAMRAGVLATPVPRRVEGFLVSVCQRLKHLAARLFIFGQKLSAAR